MRSAIHRMVFCTILLAGSTAYVASAQAPIDNVIAAYQYFQLNGQFAVNSIADHTEVGGSTDHPLLETRALGFDASHSIDQLKPLLRVRSDTLEIFAGPKSTTKPAFLAAAPGLTATLEDFEQPAPAGPGSIIHFGPVCKVGMCADRTVVKGFGLWAASAGTIATMNNGGNALVRAAPGFVFANGTTAILPNFFVDGEAIGFDPPVVAFGGEFTHGNFSTAAADIKFFDPSGVELATLNTAEIPGGLPGPINSSTPADDPLYVGVCVSNGAKNLGYAFMSQSGNGIEMIDNFTFGNPTAGICFAPPPAPPIPDIGTVIFPCTPITRDVTWTAANSPYRVACDLYVGQSGHLTLEPGSVVKLGQHNSLIVSGKLTAQGTDAKHVVITSSKDDSAGGDSNRDGDRTQAGAGDWGSLVAAGGSIELLATDVRYGGGSSECGGLGMITVGKNPVGCNDVANSRTIIDSGSELAESSREAVWASGFGNTLDVHRSTIRKSTEGVLSVSATSDLRYNYWDDVTGPTGTGLSGSGSRVATDDRAQIVRPWRCTPDLPKRPVIVVHGWQNVGSFRAEDGVACFDPGLKNSTLGRIPEWLYSEDDGARSNYDVWIAHITTGDNGTPTLEDSADALAEQIQDVVEASDGREVAIVAHSMGGIVSRIAISRLLEQQPRLHESVRIADQFPVRALYTLGSPHAGLGPVSIMTLESRLAFQLDKWAKELKLDRGGFWNLKVKTQQAIIQLHDDPMKETNSLNPNVPGVSYAFFGGTVRDWDSITSQAAYTEPLNDGVVGAFSAVGWLAEVGVSLSLQSGLFFEWNASEQEKQWTHSSPPSRHWVNEVHSEDLLFSNAYYECVSEHPCVRSNSFKCIMAYEHERSPSDCGSASPKVTLHSSPLSPLVGKEIHHGSRNGSALDYAQQGTQEARMHVIASPLITGTITSNEVVSRTIAIDSGSMVEVSTTWWTGPIAVTLQRPDGEVLSLESLAAHPDRGRVMSLPQTNLSLAGTTFVMTNTISGQWVVRLSAGDLDGGSSPFYLRASMVSPIMATLRTDKGYYPFNSLIAAELDLGGDVQALENLAVTATVTWPDGRTERLQMTPGGGRTYTTTFNAGRVSGSIAISVAAEGEADGTAFHLAASAVVGVVPSFARIAGPATVRQRDDDANRLHDWLDADLEIGSTGTGALRVSGQLLADGRLVALGLASADIVPGSNIVRLSFSGDAIRQSGVSGPYQLANVHLFDPQAGSYPVDEVRILTSTPAWDYRTFGSFVIGDCNGDNRSDAADLGASVLEIFDDDGDDAEFADLGSFVGSRKGCDSNGDRHIDAGDISCLVKTIFDGPGSCAQP